MPIDNEQGKHWFAVDVQVEAQAVEPVEYAFNTLDALGTEIDHLRKSAYDSVTVTAYFDELPSDADLEAAFRTALLIFSVDNSAVRSLSTREVADEDWLAEWKRHWKPAEIGRFVVAPPWAVVEETDKIVIRIEPNMAFGTGTHETTQLCLKAIGEIYQPRQSFLDVGTGTGILAIAAAKLTTKNIANLTDSFGAGITGYDTDADSVNIAIENAAANHVGDTIEFFHGPIDYNTPPFDFVCANLTVDVIVPLLPLLLAKTESILLLSGILVEQKAEIASALSKSQISNFKVETAGEWIAVLVDQS